MNLEFYIKKLSNYLVKNIQRFIKKDDKMVILGSWLGNRFSDNSRYLFCYLSENKKKYDLKRIIFVTDSKEIYRELREKKEDVLMKKSVKSAFYHMKAKYHLIDQSPSDIFKFFSINAIRVNLWHGFPMKKIGKFEKNYDLQNRRTFGGWEDFFLLTGSNLGDETTGYAFDIKKEKMLHGMFPRNHYLLNENFELLEEEKVIKKIIDRKKSEGKKIIFYLPTFRDKKQIKFLGEDNLEKINNFLTFLEDNNYFLLTKLHFAGTHIMKRKKDAVGTFEKTIMNLKPHMDVYPFLKDTDILITDYSSVYFDFLYLGRDIIFYPYDLEYYKKEDRGIIWDYNDMTPGDKVYNIEELQKNLIIKKSKRDDYLEKRREVLKKCFENYTIEDTVKNILFL